MSGESLRDESLTRISALAIAFRDNISGQVILETLYPDMNPTKVLLDLSTINSLVNILGTTYATIVGALSDAKVNSTGEPSGEDHAGGGVSRSE